LHCIWTLPQNDYNYSTRWKVIKAGFSRQYLHELKLAISLSPSKIEKGEAGLWQRRFWEHTIRDEDDLNRHIEYIHYNPVKHGLVEEVKAWPWSSFHRFVQEGIFDENWGSNHPDFGDLAVIE
jgi:putative transposase